MTSRSEVEYHLAGLEQELRDGLARLERADSADDHVEWYRRAFDRYVRKLRRELDRPAPDIHEIAVSAMQAAWLARIWPVLHATRAQYRAPKNLRARNASRHKDAVTKQQRCVAIAKTLKHPTPAAVGKLYRQRFAGEPIPSPSSIRRYLK